MVATPGLLLGIQGYCMLLLHSGNFKIPMENHHFVIFESLRDEYRPHPVNRTERKEAGSWQLTGVKLGRPWPKLGQTRANLGSTC